MCPYTGAAKLRSARRQEVRVMGGGGKGGSKRGGEADLIPPLWGQSLVGFKGL